VEQSWSKAVFFFFQEVGLKDGRIERLKLELERKDAEIQKLKAVITQWEVCIHLFCKRKELWLGSGGARL
jgi:hypothetical protein